MHCCRTRFASSRSSSSSGSEPSPKPRAISSGGPAEPPFDDASVATMISTPSSDRRRRSRRATSCTSPTPSPSTKDTPVDTSSTTRTPSRESSTTVPFSARMMLAAGTPASRASCACAACMRYSPWTGMTARGRSSDSSVRSSSEQAWPETCTGAISWCRTSAPAFASWLIVSCTRSSFPGTGLAEMITVSPRSTCSAGWSLYAMRVSAESGSPWLPVQRISCSCGA